MTNFDSDAVLDTTAAANFTGLAVATLAKLRCIGGGPAYLKLGRKVVYRAGDLAHWLSTRRVYSTSEASVSVPGRLFDGSNNRRSQRERNDKCDGGEQ
jgi:hypothetical protein